MTGMNAQPLGAPRRWGSGPAAAPAGGAEPPKRPADDMRYGDGRRMDDARAEDNGPRKRRSRWGSASERADLGSAAISGNVSGQELDRYAIQVRLEEITRKLRSGNVVPPDRERSPSPPPTYDGYGRRTNTREVRYRRKLEEERVQLVERQMRLDPYYRPPTEYHAAKRNMRPTEKVYLPVREFPEINFFGLLVGPRGNTLKRMERESGAKIHIRGRGSVKHGKGSGEEEEEDMHCIVTADSERAIKLCIKLINEVIATAASTPEAQNDHKRSQLRELAVLNGTLRDDENQICQNCGEKGHRKFECPHERNWTSHIICHRCGGQGHLARDCMAGRGYGPQGMMGPGMPAPGMPGPGVQPGQENQVDSEYANLMAELGERPEAGMHPPGGMAGAGPLFNEKGEKIPPWRDPNVWNTPGPGRGGAGAGAGGMNYQGGAMYDQGWGYGGYSDQWQGYTQAPEGQQDYSAEWAAYYAAQAAQQGGESAGAEGEQRDYSKEWEEYYRQQAMAQQQAPQ